MQIKIGHKVVLAIITSIVFVSAAIGMTSISLVDKFLHQQVTSRLIDSSNNVSTKLDIYVETAIKGLENLSNNETIRLYMQEPEKIHISQVQDLFLALSDRYTDLTLLDITNRELAKVVKEKITVKLMDNSERDYFKVAQSQNGFYISGYTQHDKQQEHIEIGKIVTNTYEEQVGIIVTNILYEKLHSIIYKSSIDKNFTIAIVDKKMRPILGAPHQDLLNAHVENDNNFFHLGAHDQEQMIAISTAHTLGWKVMVSLPHDIFVADINTLKKSILLVTFSFAAGAAIVSFLFSKQFTKPIIQLTKAAKNIAEGNYSTQIQLQTNDELNDLAKSFSFMAQEIHDSERALVSTRDSLEAANTEVSTLIQKAMTDIHTRYQNPSLVQCWEYMQCGKKDCPSYQSEDLRCWQSAGTFCGGEVQGFFAQKYDNCIKCGVYLSATANQSRSIGENFNNMMHILQIKHRELEKANNQLSKTQSQLVKQEKMASIGTLAGGIAHEFNNILAAMIGYSDMAKDDAPEGSQTKKDLEKVLKAGGRAKELVNQILLFSNIHEDKLVPVQVNHIIKKVMDFLEKTTPSSIEIRQDISTDTKNVLAHPAKLQQVFVNLYTNALQALNGKGVIEIHAEDITLSEEDVTDLQPLLPGEYVKITLTDDGPGMEPEIQNRIFDPFFTTKQVGQGTGMGLAVVHGIIEKFNGFISLDSEPGKGTTVNSHFT